MTTVWVPMKADELRRLVERSGHTQKYFSAFYRIPLRTLVRYLHGDPIPEPTAMLIRIKPLPKRRKK